ncbi:MAG TPA: FeoA family protein [Burkholderiaceae bacterium]|nr:FeoA family protein [Burkholderiaceae bacterium]
MVSRWDQAAIGPRAAFRADEALSRTFMSHAPSTLHDLPLRTAARIQRVRPLGPQDPVAARLDELGFVPGATVRVVARGPLGGEPIAVQVGSTRFALRRSEAERVDVSLAATGCGVVQR